MDTKADEGEFIAYKRGIKVTGASATKQLHGQVDRVARAYPLREWCCLADLDMELSPISDRAMTASPPGSSTISTNTDPQDVSAGTGCDPRTSCDVADDE